MINERLNEIEKDLKEIKKYVESNNYFKKVEEQCIKNNFREEKIEMLQNRIDRAITYIERDMIELLNGKIISYNISQIDVKELLNILKGDNK